MLDLDGPKSGEVLIRNVASGVCHTDAFTLSGEDPEGIFPAVLGHEGVIESQLLEREPGSAPQDLHVSVLSLQGGYGNSGSEY